jgi:hypothetical protein
VSWARLNPRTIQSGTKSRSGHTRKGNPYLRAALGAAAATVGKTDTFLGEHLFNLVYDPAFLVHAWERVSTNKGAQTAGIDKATAAGIETWVYLHYVLDWWADWWRGRHARGDVIIVRFADDCAPRTLREVAM